MPRPSARTSVAPDSTKDLRLATYQIALERRHFSVGTIDGQLGSRNRKSLTWYQRSHGLTPTGTFDQSNVQQLGAIQEPFDWYVISSKDMDDVQSGSATHYQDAWEMLAEKFHTTPQFLRQLNPQISDPQEGSRIKAPNLAPSLPLQKIERIEIHLQANLLLAYGRGNKLIACFPCSIAADPQKRPLGQYHVTVVAPQPNYTLSQSEKKKIIPPGPNNPVGVGWIGLSLPTYGIHGTPNPSQISATGSKGCFSTFQLEHIQTHQSRRSGHSRGSSIIH